MDITQGTPFSAVFFNFLFITITKVLASPFDSLLLFILLLHEIQHGTGQEGPISSF